MNNATSSIVYKYSITLTYNYNGKDVVIDHINLPIFAMYRDYVNQNRPVIYATVNVDKRMLADMIENVNKKYIVCNIDKIAISPEYLDDTDKMDKSPRIRILQEQFIYATPSTNESADDEIVYGGNEEREDIFISAMVGLISPSTLKYNTREYGNAHYHNTKVSDVILHNCNHIPKLVYQPVEMNPEVTNTVPAKSTSEFIANLFLKYKFYKTGYRLFYDYDYTYLLSNSGVPVKCRGEEISSIIFNIHDTSEDESKIKGMVTNTYDAYHVIDLDNRDVEPLDTKDVVDVADDIEQASIDGIIETRSKKEIDMLYIVKEGLDTNQFTINKEYFVDHYNKLDNRRGRFILLSKKDLYSKEGEYYKVNTVLVLKFIKYE